MASGDAKAPADARQRIDKWLWYARFMRSRGLAAELAASGKLRINGDHCSKAAQPVRPGDVLTFPQGSRIRIIRVEATGVRRGPSVEAATLYTDLDPAAETPPKTQADHAPGERPQGSGRPTKRERREIDMLRRNGS